MFTGTESLIIVKFIYYSPNLLKVYCRTSFHFSSFMTHGLGRLLLRADS